MEEWPLIIFTLLVQGSVGLTIAMSFFLLCTGSTLPVNERRRALLPLILVATVAAAGGLAASTLHLGYPLNAFHALRHVESSWLSREIVFASLYLAAIGFAALLVLFLRRLSLALLLVASVLGLIDVFCMGAIYTHSGVATWTHFNTWVMFFGSTLSIGATVGLCGFALLKPSGEGVMHRVTMGFVAVLVVSTLLRLLEQMAYFSYLAKASLSTVVTFPHQPLAAFEQLRPWYLAAWAVLVAGVMLQCLFARSKGSKAVLLAGGCAVIVAEITLRVVFFSLN